MSARKTEMHQLQEAIRLHRLGRSRRRIASDLRMGRDTVRAYLAAFAAKGLLEGPAEQLPDVETLRSIVQELSGGVRSMSEGPSRPSCRSYVQLGTEAANPTSAAGVVRGCEPQHQGSGR